ncbi:hypothetical protein E2C01_083643 [Portunus trituberculatus]|uniref:Uncharacterized protein n=1 Tax=Portunus trituberculatus TaxID=210409 RepID=A0A5B7J8J6_PORTR|nr:hypothetical protein [Portunus trituberculatus]
MTFPPPPPSPLLQPPASLPPDWRDFPTLAGPLLKPTMKRLAGIWQEEHVQYSQREVENNGDQLTTLAKVR